MWSPKFSTLSVASQSGLTREHKGRISVVTVRGTGAFSMILFYFFLFLYMSAQNIGYFDTVSESRGGRKKTNTTVWEYLPPVDTR